MNLQTIKDRKVAAARRILELRNSHQDGQEWTDTENEELEGLHKQMTDSQAAEDRGSMIGDANDFLNRTSTVPDGMPLHGQAMARDSVATEYSPESRYLERGFGSGDSMHEATNEALKRKGHDTNYGGMGFGDAVRAWMFRPRNEFEQRALSEGTDTAGGFTVPESLSAQFFDRLRPLSRVLEAGVRIVPFGSNVSKFARIATDPTSAWLAENASMSPSDMTFGSVSFQSHTLRTVVVASEELLQDSLNIAEAIEMSLSKSFASELDRVVLVGSGTGEEPEGILNISGVTTETGGAVSDWSYLVDLMTSLQDANVQNVGAAIMSPATLKKYANLVATGGDEQPKQRPFTIANTSLLQTTQCPDANIFMCDWSQVMLGVRTQFVLKRLKERYAENYQQGFLAALRADVQVIHPVSAGVVTGIT